MRRGRRKREATFGLTARCVGSDCQLFITLSYPLPKQTRHLARLAAEWGWLVAVGTVDGDTRRVLSFFCPKCIQNSLPVPAAKA